MRTLNDLVDRLDDESAWRKQEIAALHRRLGGQSTNFERETLRRAAMPILYAHFEGFFVAAARYYLQFVIDRGLVASELDPRFSAAALRGRIRDAGAAKKIGPHIELAKTFEALRDQPVWFDVRSVVDAESNLNSEVLQDLFRLVGVEFAGAWVTAELVQDQQLLRTRNQVAHGERQEVSNATYEQCRQFVLDAVDRFKLQLVGAAERSAYRVAS